MTRSRRTETRYALSILPVAALLIIGCSLCIAMAGAPDSNGTADDTFDAGDYRFAILGESPGSRTVELEEYIGNGDEAAIPSTVDHDGAAYKVVSIGENAFKEKPGLKSVTIPDSVTCIGDRAFFECTGLTAVTISGPVTYIGDFAFFDCYALSSITIPDSVEYIGSSAFFHTSITSFAFPDSITTIEDFMFYECERLASVTIPDSVTVIEKYAFCGCRGLTSITIPDSVTSIEEGAFGHTGASSVTIPGSVESIEDYTFYYCQKLTSVTIPGSVTSIGKGAFENTGLTSVTIPGSVEYIGAYAFFDCKSMEKAAFGEHVSSIGNMAFGFYNDDGASERTAFYDEYGTALDTSDAGEFRGRMFTGSMTEMTREEGYVLIFDPGNGTSPWAETHSPGASIAKPADPEKSGCTFQCWVTADGTEFDFENDAMPESGLTLTALWSTEAAGDGGNGNKAVAAVAIAVVCIVAIALLVMHVRSRKH